jgi:hypothetical protein
LRVLAVRLHVRDQHGKTVTLFLVSAYAPEGAAAPAVREEYWSCLQECLDERKEGDVLVLGTDGNASCGRRSKHNDPFAPGRDQVRGPFGAPYENAAGKEQCSFLSLNQLCLASTYFQKSNYDTWQNPCSKRWHQIDHVIVAQKDLKRVKDAGRVGMLGKDSDHRAVQLQLRVRRLKRKPCADAKAVRIDRALLRVEETRDEWLQGVKERVAKDRGDASSLQHLQQSMRDAAEEFLADSGRKQPGWFKAQESVLKPAILARNAAQVNDSRFHTSQTKQKLKRCRKEVNRLVLFAERAWLRAELTNVESLRDNTGLVTPKEAWAAIARLRGGKSVTKKLVVQSFANEDGTKCKTPAESFERMRGYQTKVWDKVGAFDAVAIELVRQRDPKIFAWMDYNPSDKEISAAIRKLSNWKSGADTKCPAEYYKAMEYDEETREYIRAIVHEVWSSGSYLQPAEPAPPPEPPPEHEGKHDSPQRHHETASPQQLRRSHREHAPSATAINNATYSKTPTKERKARAARDERKEQEGPELFTRPPKDVEADNDGVLFPEWKEARLKLLPKKGDLSQCKNWRGICLLDIASKIFSNILVARLQNAQEVLGMEAQCGFRGERGTIDGLWNIAVALAKRKEHNLETWALYVDLVKAFDSVSREALFAVLRKFGLPDHFINLVARLHTGVTIKLKLGDDDVEISSTIGVRQGSCEGPVLFLFIMQAALETMDWPVAKPTFCTKELGPITGAKNWKRNVTNFELWSSLFADDCGLLFETRDDLVAGANYIFAHLKRFGLLMHVGRGNTVSKTEAVYYPPPRQPADSGDQSDFAVDGDGFISFSTEFVYLGSLLHQTLTCGADVDRRIVKASAAFGALQYTFFKNRLPTLEDKGLVFATLCISILLYGCECWSLKEKELQRLRVFYNRCIRSMCKVTMRQVFVHRISTAELLKRLGIRSLDYYYNTRLLRWAGHVARMPMTRTPRRLLTSWVDHKRLVGAPAMTIGRTINKALKTRSITADFKKWNKLAQDRGSWRGLIDPLRARNSS